jgi:hypothetical protein
VQKIKAYAWPSVVAVALALSLGLSAWNTIRPVPSPIPPVPIPAPLVEPTDENPLIVPAEITLPDRGMIRLPLKTLGTVRIALYPGTDKVLQVEQFGADVMLSRRSQVAEDVSLGLQVEHKGKVSQVVWVLVRLNLAPLPPPTPEPEPAPKPKPEPTPDASKVESAYVVICEDTSKRTPAEGKAITTIPGWLTARGHKFAHVSTKDPAFVSEGYKTVADAMGVPTVIVLDATAKDAQTPVATFRLNPATLEADLAKWVK